MKDKPILFSTPMVKAILEGRKTQTRRIIKLTEFRKSDTKGYNWQFRDKRALWNDVNTDLLLSKFCPYQIGQTLWVRETWCIDTDGFHYKADNNYIALKELGGWKPSIFMPKEACRLFLKVTNIRVERLQDISLEDCIAEGISSAWTKEDGKRTDLCWSGNTIRPEKEYFHQLWNFINEKRGYPWESNPYVWGIEFKRIEQ